MQPEAFPYNKAEGKDTATMEMLETGIVGRLGKHVVSLPHNSDVQKSKAYDLGKKESLDKVVFI